MCGIAGLIMKKALNVDSINRFIKSADLMSHRGPDNKGVIRKDNVILIHFRLSIIDLESRSNQPFISTGEKCITVYNGEIYNYKELGHKYKIESRTNSDTEIMLESFSRVGDTVVVEWNGIFATVIYDIVKEEVSFIRDRFGVKPLYFMETDEVIAFASEAKVILDWLDEFRLNNKVLSQYLWFGNSTGSETMVRGLNMVPPGIIYKFSLKKNTWLNPYKFWSISEIKERKVNVFEAAENTRYLLEKAVNKQLMSDAPLGILLSGGIDSSCITAFASKHSLGKIDTYTAEYDFVKTDNSEVRNAKIISEKYNTRFNLVPVKIKNVIDTFSDLVFQYDLPFSDSASIPLYQLAKECGKSKKVILQGDGGDELFAGYRRYNILDNYLFWKKISRYYQLIPNWQWRNRIKRLNFVLSQKHDADLFAYYLSEEVPYNSPFNILNSEYIIEETDKNWKFDYELFNSQLSDLDKIQRILYIDTSILLPYRFLEKVDKATMLCSVEARVPFLDNELADFALSLPSKLKVRRGSKKFILKKAMHGIIPKQILDGRKQGFNAPVSKWLKKDLFHFAKNCFDSHSLGIIDASRLNELLKQHVEAKGNFSATLWKGLVLCKWLEVYEKKIKI